MSAPTEEGDRTRLQEELRLARRELKLAHGRQEEAEETLQRVRRQRAGLRDQARLLADTLAAMLSEHYWAAQSGGSGLGRLRGRRKDDSEREAVAAVESSELFDGGWYLRHQPDAVREMVPAALHYVRHAATTQADPGPNFDTARYLEEHPEARGTDCPALLHHLGLGPSPRG